MTIQVGFCQTWSETPKTCFLASRLISFLILGTFYGEGMLSDVPWEARVEYTLEAQVIDANELKVHK